MKNIVYSLTLLTLVMGFATVTPTYASAPAGVTITQVMSQAPPSTFDPTTGLGTNFGTWTSSGAFVDSGTAAEAFRLKFGQKDVLQYVKAEETLTSSSNAANTITIVINFTKCNFEVFPLLTCDGPWEIVSGTGAYSGIEGAGTALVTVNVLLAVNTITSTGVVLF